jgi:hypothetical protein
MESQLIYILDEKIPYGQLKEQLEKTQPLTKEEVVDLIISNVDDKDQSNFKSFEKKYLKTSFTNLSNQAKDDILLEDLKNLENLYENLGVWNDPNELRSDVLANLISFHFVDGKTVLYIYQINDLIKTAYGYKLLSKKKEYLNQALNELNQIFQLSNKNSNTSEIKIIKQFVPEKWYALLHIILISLHKKEPILDLSDKIGITQLGKDHYKFRGTGQIFCQEIKNIKTCSPAVYISNMSPKDRKIMKALLIELSGDDADVIQYLKKIPK